MRAMFASQDLWDQFEDGFEELVGEQDFNALTQA